MNEHKKLISICYKEGHACAIT